MDKTTILGSGAYGEVYKMNVNGQDVAVKFIKNNENGIRELGEVNLLKKFEHPNILKRLDTLFILPTEIGIILPLATTDLYKAIKIGVSVDTKERWVYELLSGMNFIHKNGYYHCDIKPANVLIINDIAVIADPGFMGLQILKSTICQSLASPQLLYKRSDISDKRKMSNPIYRKPFTNSQSDLWALGETIYYVANGEYPIANDVDKMNKYITTNVLPEERVAFNSVIKTLMNPDPEELSINLTVLLGEEPFNGTYADYICGTINNNIANKNPVIFTPLLKKQFSILFSLLIEICERRSLSQIVLYNTIDMFYRVFILIKGQVEYNIFICACLSISCKIYGNDIEISNTPYVTGNKSTREKILATEKIIVEFLEGILDRDLPLFYGVNFKNFKSWITENPEKYEQFNMAGLIREINVREINI